MHIQEHHESSIIIKRLTVKNDGYAFVPLKDDEESEVLKARNCTMLTGIAAATATMPHHYCTITKRAKRRAGPTVCTEIQTAVIWNRAQC